MFPIIDRKRTGIRLRRIMDERGLSVKDVQQYLHFKPNAAADDQLEESLLLLLKESYAPDSGSRYIT